MCVISTEDAVEEREENSNPMRLYCQAIVVYKVATA